MTNEVASVPRAFGFINRVDAKQKQPIRKEVIETRDFNQPSGLLRG